MRTLLIIFSFLICSCAPTGEIATKMVSLPKYTNAWQIYSLDEWPRPSNVSLALDIFYEHWKQKFGDKEGKVLHALNTILIEWTQETPKRMLGYTADGNIKTGKPKGIAISPGYIKIWKNQYNRIASTAFIHELVHIALWNTGNPQGDPDHEGTMYKGWTLKHTKLVNNLNKILANMNI